MADDDADDDIVFLWQADTVKIATLVVVVTSKNIFNADAENSDPDELKEYSQGLDATSAWSDFFW